MAGYLKAAGSGVVNVLGKTANGLNYASGGTLGDLAKATAEVTALTAGKLNDITGGRLGNFANGAVNVADSLTSGYTSTVLHKVAEVLELAPPVSPEQNVSPVDKVLYDDIGVRLAELHVLLTLCDERKNVFVPVSTLRHIIGKKKNFENMSAFNKPGQMDIIESHAALADMMARAVANKEEYLDIDDLM